MDVDPVALAKMPPVGELIGKGISKTDFYNALRFSDDAAVIQVLETYDSLPLDDRDRVPVDAVLLKSGAKPETFLGAAILALREYSANKVKILGITAHPEVMEKTIEYALLPNGIRDREHVHTMLGALQPAKGLNIFQSFRGVVPNTPPGVQPPAPVEMERDANAVFPDASSVQDRLTAVRQKMLESGE